MHDYSRKKGVAWSGIMLPDNAPAEYKDRTTLWNAVEKAEKASNSQLAREIQIALPRELDFSQHFGLVTEYVRENFTRHGMCADIAIHTDKEKQNPHCHILLTMRPFKEDGTWDDKQKKVYILDDNGEKVYDPKKRQYKCNKIQTTDWNERHKAEEWRASWADLCNNCLEQLNRPERIDHRSYKRQGKSQLPTIHLGTAAHQMEQKGILTERGNINRAIEISNRKLRQLAERINELQGWLAEEKALLESESTLPPMTKIEQPTPTPKPQLPESKPPTFAKSVLGILTRQAQGRPLSYADTTLFSFLAHNNITDYDSLKEHFINLTKQQRELGDEFTPIRKRLAVLTEHINQNENYKELKTEYNQYKQDLAKQMPWKKKSFAEDNCWVVERYNEAKTYIDGVRNANGKIPLVSWQKEHSELSAKLQELNGRYQTLKTQVDQVDKFRVRVYDVLWKEQQKTQPTKKRSHDWDR